MPVGIASLSKALAFQPLFQALYPVQKQYAVATPKKTASHPTGDRKYPTTNAGSAAATNH